MEALTINDLEPSLAKSLRRSADTNGRTVEQEAVVLIKAGLSRSGMLTRRQRAEAISAMTPKGVQQTDSTLLIREDRDDPDR